jgi:hypothetical protein
MPYAVTSLFPLVLFPMLNILPGDEVGHNYFKVNIISFAIYNLFSFLKGYNNFISW